MYHHPSWKDDDKIKFIDTKGFDLTTSTKKQGQERSAWDIRPIKLVDQEGEKYIDGYETIGDCTRRRDRTKEMSKELEFDPNLKVDIWGTKNHVSQSTRTKTANTFLKIQPYYEDFSENRRLDHQYKPALIDTASADRVVPFAYSER